MSTNFGIPPKGDQVRALVDQRLRQARADDGAKVTVDWRGEQKHLYVITMPIDMLYYNPDTHRIRAQRSLDPERNQVLAESPWSEPAQEYLHFLLTRNPSNPDQTDPDYVTLREEIDEFGQKEPGIISPHGILVDGNTRRAAFADLGKIDLRVGVLPDDTSRRDINKVELYLQLRRDKRREYSYVNRLIAIEEELATGRQPSDVARDFNIKKTTLEKDRWVYELILEAIERSATGEGHSLRLIDFEDHQEKLRELHRDFTALTKTDPEAAEQLKESRLAMVLLNYSKTSVRLAEADFHTRYLDDRLPDELQPEQQGPTATPVPGLPTVIVPESSALTKTTRGLTDKLLRAKAVAQSDDTTDSGKVAAADALMKSARDTFDTAVKLAGKNAELRKKQTAVPERLTDAAEYINQCVKEFAEARSKRTLDEESFDDALVTLRESLRRLARLAQRAFTSPGDGVAWLISSSKDE